MSVRDLIPWGRTARSSAPTTMRGDEVSPFLTLHREMNRLFDDVFNSFGNGAPAPFGAVARWPSVEVSETDKEVRVSAELPGMAETDIELLVEDDVLTLRGEKRAERSDEARGFSERSYGRFERSIGLPYAVEKDRAEATFANGVLTVTLPRSEKAAASATRIPIKGAAAH